MSRRAGAAAGSPVRGRAGARGADRPAGRGEAGDTLAFLVIWPTLLVAILVLLVHAFIVSNARAEAEVAASAGLRAAWHSAADADFLNAPGTPDVYVGEAPHPAVRRMSEDVKDAVARVAAEEDGWRWWTPGIAEVYSDWCADPAAGDRPSDPADPGWVRVVVSGDVFGPVAALWPDRLARVHAVATGPAVLNVSPQQIERWDASGVPVYLPPC